MICPHCGGNAVKNGSVRAVCRDCGRSFNVPRKEEEIQDCKVDIEQLI